MNTTQLTVIALKYQNDLIEYYEKLRHLPGFVLLDSSNRARYDIVSACPYHSWRITAKDNWANLFTDIENKMLWQDSNSNLPFQGGAIGFFTYDMANLAAKLTQLPSYFCLPIAYIGLYDWAIIADHRQKTVQLVAANTQSNTLEIINQVQTLWQQSSKKPIIYGTTQPFKPLITKEKYCQSVKIIKDYLRSGRCYQVNYTQPFVAEYQGDSWAIYKKIRQTNPMPYSAYLKEKNYQILSFSPEQFLALNRCQLTASPIKGTIKCADDPIIDKLLQQQLLSCRKNKAENTMIVDLMRNDLGKIAKSGTVKVPVLCQLQSFPKLHHLVSTVTAEVSDKGSLFQILAACFPGGSITGAPKLEAMKVIQEQEYYARGVYCGMIGYFSSHKRFDTNIAIRTITAYDNQLYLATGGGIVIDSDIEEEYQECLTKIQAIKEALK